MAGLHLVGGAPGSGKSTVLPLLAAEPFAAVDFDELLEPGGRLLGTVIASPAASALWPSYNGLWARVVSLLLRAGRPVLVTCPLTPAEWAEATAGVEGLPPAEWARLDCADADRADRLSVRGWQQGRIEGALADARELRRLVDREFTTTGRSPTEVAAELARWVTGGAPGRDRPAGSRPGDHLSS
ncbi:Broad-specificity NMP kinase [Streptomyces zhaozhouensis]|uniref:Broad-specificity NMP kinase n=1 Tax=Streptomyces zhaozhouensis TaxID=1300267 RepID=A0A286DZP0_9ACTN|nr:hypothetical protein [Streptomyces zhaozhouensis]SOD64121.1 Broad-specificity NMP kinase [Streptomyces zhaozhouensis]